MQLGKERDSRLGRVCGCYAFCCAVCCSSHDVGLLQIGHCCIMGGLLSVAVRLGCVLCSVIARAVQYFALCGAVVVALHYVCAVLCWASVPCCCLVWLHLIPDVLCCALQGC